MALAISLVDITGMADDAPVVAAPVVASIMFEAAGNAVPLDDVFDITVLLGVVVGDIVIGDIVENIE